MTTDNQESRGGEQKQMRTIADSMTAEQFNKRIGKGDTNQYDAREPVPKESVSESDELKIARNLLHSLWGKWHDGVTYSQSIKDEFGKLQFSLFRLDNQSQSAEVQRLKKLLRRALTYVPPFNSDGHNNELCTEIEAALAEPQNKNKERTI